MIKNKKVAFVVALHQSKTHRLNGFELFNELLGSLYISCEYPFKIFAFDNASDDKFEIENCPDNLSITIVDAQYKGGCTYTWNEGIKQAILEDYDVVIITSDDQIYNETVNDFVDTILTHEHRDDAMYTYAIFVREAKGSVTVKDLEEFNKTFKEPLSNLNKFIKQVENPKSFYKCTSQPMASNCDKEECLFRKFGIGNHTKEESYFKNFAFVKNWNAVVKFSPDPVLLKPQEATNVMKIEKKVIINGETLSNTFDYWLKNRARKSAVDVQEWQPGKPTFYERDGMHGKVKVYNAFKPTNLKPVEGDIALWEDYLAKRFKDEECNKYIQDFIAHKVQRPDVKTMSNLILYSDTGGTGKSHIDEVVQELLGPHNCVSIDLSDLETGWGDIIINKLWISIEEIHNTGNPRKRIANIIKRLTTVKRMFGNMKYGKFVQADVYASLMMNSNEQTALSIKEED